MSQEKFDPKEEFQPIIDRLKKEGRMPSLEEFQAAVAKVRPKYLKELEELRRREKQDDVD